MNKLTFMNITTDQRQQRIKDGVARKLRFQKPSSSKIRTMSMLAKAESLDAVVVCEFRYTRLA